METHALNTEDGGGWSSIPHYSVVRNVAAREAALALGTLKRLEKDKKICKSTKNKSNEPGHGQQSAGDRILGFCMIKSTNFKQLEQKIRKFKNVRRQGVR